jgi:hypothetical protein
LYYDQQATDGYVEVGSALEKVKKDASYYITDSIDCKLPRTTSGFTQSGKAPTLFGTGKKARKKHPTSRRLRLALTRCRLKINNHLGGKAPLLLTYIV